MSRCPQSKLSSDVVNKAVDTILAFSAGKDIQVNDKTVVKGKKRKFLETVELQIGACGGPFPKEVVWGGGWVAW